MANTSWSGQRQSFPRATRRRILQRDGECQLRLDGCTGQPDEADHIVSHANALRLGWTQAEIDHADNGRAVCRSCHAIVTRSQQTAGRARRAVRRPVSKHPGLM